MRTGIEEIGETGIVKRTFFVETGFDDTAWRFKQIIEEQEGIPAGRQTLYGNGKVEDTWMPWHDCGLCYGHKLQMRQRPPKHKAPPSPTQISVNVVGEGGRYMCLDASNMDAVGILKQKTAQEAHLPLESLQLTSFDGKLLQDDSSLADYNIGDGCTVYLQSEHATDMGRWKKQEEVEIRLKADLEMDVRVGVLDTVCYVKKLIKKQAGIPEEDTLRLFFAHKNLDDSHNLNYYNIRDGSILYARRQRAKAPRKVKENKKIRIIVVIEDEEELTLEMNIFDKICDLYIKIFAKTGIPVEDQGLGDFMVHLTLSDYDMEDGRVLNLHYPNGRVRVPVSLARKATQVLDGIPKLPEWVTGGDRLPTSRPGILKWSEVEGYQYFLDFTDLPTHIPMPGRDYMHKGHVNWLFYVGEFYCRNYLYWYSSGAFKCTFKSQNELENDEIYSSVSKKMLMFHACRWFDEQVRGEQQHGKDFDINKYVEGFARQESKEPYWTIQDTPVEG